MVIGITDWSNPPQRLRHTCACNNVFARLPLSWTGNRRLYCRRCVQESQLNWATPLESTRPVQSSPVQSSKCAASRPPADARKVVDHSTRIRAQESQYQLLPSHRPLPPPKSSSSGGIEQSSSPFRPPRRRHARPILVYNGRRGVSTTAARRKQTTQEPAREDVSLDARNGRRSTSFPPFVPPRPQRL